jgi:hypothetical protein
VVIEHFRCNPGRRQCRKESCQREIPQLNRHVRRKPRPPIDAQVQR